MKIKSLYKQIIKLNCINEVVTLTLCLLTIFLIINKLISGYHRESIDRKILFLSNYLEQKVDYRYYSQPDLYKNIPGLINYQNYSPARIIIKESLNANSRAEYSLSLQDILNRVDSDKLTGVHIIKSNNNIYCINRFKSMKESITIIYNVSLDKHFTNNIRDLGFAGYSCENLYNYILPVSPQKIVPADSVFFHTSLNRFQSVPMKGSLRGLDIITLNDNVKRQSANVLHFLLFLGFLKFITAMIITRKTITRLKDPLNELISKTHKLTSSVSREKLNEEDYIYREYRCLAGTFNQVLKRRELSEINLCKSFEQLEEIVHTRTKELREANDKLTVAITKAEDANKSKSQFLANISHEIRTPLNCIIGFCDILLTEYRDIKINEHVSHILHESETLLNLINDILDHSKIDAGKMSLHETNINLEEMISSLVNSGNVQKGEKPIDITYTLSPSVPEIIVCDGLRLYQVVSNLFYNAIKFTESGEISIKANATPLASPKECLLKVEVKDTGIGIPDDKIHTIFDKFEQVDGSLTRKYRGSGLGLTISKRIVELMRGNIIVKSHEGMGSTFIIELPVKASQHSIEQVENCIMEAGKEDMLTGTILLVDDYQINQIVAKKHLEMAGHTVITADNGREAADICESTPFDLILMDLQMPVLDGYSAAEIIRNNCSLNQDVPILAMTANAMESVKPSCIAAGMDDVITKPIRKKNFLNSVSQWLQSRVPV